MVINCERGCGITETFVFCGGKVNCWVIILEVIFGLRNKVEYM